jgi:hypothetical protein
MKYFIQLFVSIVFVAFANAQPNPTNLDKSPLDVSYWPANYPILKMSGKAKDEPLARVIYSRPQKNNRVIFGGIVKYNDMWRLGANEATEIELFKNVKIGNQLVKKGRYTLYCIPDTAKWTIVLNSDNYSWGNYRYDIKKDLARVEANLATTTDTVQALTIYFEDASTGSNLVMLWDTVKASLPIAVAPDDKSTAVATPTKSSKKKK